MNNKFYFDSQEYYLRLHNIEKTFTQAGKELKILDQANLYINRGEIVALLGPSGSGKSTLLQIAGLLDNFNSGAVTINNVDCSRISDGVKNYIRNKHIGFVYQFHHLLPEFQAIENVMIPQMISGINNKMAKQKAIEILDQMGLNHRLTHYPSELSGGEQQRVAIARALVNNPTIFLADEPTGNLDSDTSNQVIELLINSVRSYKLAALIVTHNLLFAKKMDRVLTLDHGKIVEI